MGVGAICTGAALAVVLTPVTASEAGAGALAVLLAGLAIAAVKLYRSGTADDTVALPPWTSQGALVSGTPEETGDPADVTGAELAALVDQACDRAQEAETVEDGFSVVRPPLRETLERVLVTSGIDRAVVDDVLASGDWTDDRIAAAVVDDRVDRPTVSLRDRIRIWLFPERIVRRETARAVAAIAVCADEELPPVVGQRAPRSMPTVAPPLGTLQRAADGTLQRARRPSPTNGSRTQDSSAGPDGGDDDASADPSQAGDDVSAESRFNTEEPSDSEPDSRTDSDDLVGEVWDDA